MSRNPRQAGVLGSIHGSTTGIRMAGSLQYDADSGDSGRGPSEDGNQLMMLENQRDEEGRNFKVLQLLQLVPMAVFYSKAESSEAELLYFVIGGASACIHGFSALYGCESKRCIQASSCVTVKSTKSCFSMSDPSFTSLEYPGPPPER
ncbi:unnamed protein product [Taenia asiatica]|uniref:Transmembrane protein n=1 Tax=Taenia asiatica TaxID=60517 RepID=A0A0R3VTB5_TAEAS|nr:unnamed protein product [Taenia asiatica]